MKDFFAQVKLDTMNEIGLNFNHPRGSFVTTFQNENRRTETSRSDS